MKQTAVEWLFSEMLKGRFNLFEVIEQAKEMEKQQIAKAYSSRCSFFSCETNKQNCQCGMNYYNETFKSK